MGDLFVFLVTKSCPTLCNPMDCSPPCSSVHGISQARRLEWVAISYPRGSSQLRDRNCVSCISCIGRRIFFFFLFFNHCTTWEAPKTDRHTYKDSVVLNAACGHPGPRADSLQVRPLEGELWSWH